MAVILRRQCGKTWFLKMWDPVSALIFSDSRCQTENNSHGEKRKNIYKYIKEMPFQWIPICVLLTSRQYKCHVISEI